MDNLLKELHERQKELKCLYSVDEILRNYERPLPEVFMEIIRIIPEGFQYPDVAEAYIRYDNDIIGRIPENDQLYLLEAKFQRLENTDGSIAVYYTIPMPEETEGPFLKEERQLLETVAERISHFILYRSIRQKLHDWEDKEKAFATSRQKDWRAVLDLLKTTDKKLYLRILRKFLNLLFWSKIDEAYNIIHAINKQDLLNQDVIENKPSVIADSGNLLSQKDAILDLIDQHFNDEEIFNLIQKWTHEDKSLFLLETVESLNTSFKDIAGALIRFSHTFSEEFPLPESFHKALVVSLIRRVLTDQLDFINIGKQFINVFDFIDLLPVIIYPPNSHGKLGGKSSGLFLAKKIIDMIKETKLIFNDIKVPRTWYISSDTLLDFIHFNNLEEVIEEKYKPIEEIRFDYPQIIQIFKNSEFPPEIIKGLILILEQVGEKPIIVRSSSLLEDRMGTAFSGKYKSLFLANQGTLEERLKSLKDAIAEVYASVFGPDPIQYRAERNLLDFNEEMGIMIQEVVGNKIGDYFFPAYAGVAFSRNEFRWSPRIKREDGLVRIVPGLGTRAVDRLSDDYPVLFSPGKPGLRVNPTPEEVLRYSPKKMDVINLKTNTFETVEISQLIKKFGRDYPNLHLMISYFEDGTIKKPLGMRLEYDKVDDMVITFDGLIERTNFTEKVNRLLRILEQQLKTPVDLEFACDGEYFYLLQCRPQSAGRDIVPAVIPRDISKNKVLFHTHKYVSNGLVPYITTIVYVVPDKYYQLQSYEEMARIGEIIGKLNKKLEAKRFILIGPGRWGSRGDIRLGVKVTYADICNTSMLVEVAMKKGNYIPDLSFGTHFFQDLVESSIRYLPIYPEEEGEIFHEAKLLDAPNMLQEILPEYAEYQDVVRVIQANDISKGRVLKIAMNAELEEALGYFGYPEEKENFEFLRSSEESLNINFHSRWREEIIYGLAQEIKKEEFGVKEMYLIGSVHEGTCGPGSDIDLVFVVENDAKKLEKFTFWLQGWNQCLQKINYSNTGIDVHNILDWHFVKEGTDAASDSYGIMIKQPGKSRRIPLKD
ncbi:MAG: hypothetical protein Kow00108_01790 [Calditrichia bacterium]